MKLFRKLLSFTLILFIITIEFPHYSFATSNINTRKPVRVGFLLYSFEDSFLSKVRQDLENIQKENENKIEFTFFDGKANPAIEYQIIDNIIQDNFDLLIVNMLKKTKDELNDIISKVKTKNIPIIFFNAPVPDTNIINVYPKAALMSIDSKEIATLQGKILVDIWNTNKKVIDKNNDNIMQYVMIQGRPGSDLTITRTKYSVEAINKAGIETQQLSSIVANWNKELVLSTLSPLFLRYGSKIEAIISNNDVMAIGAIEALQKYGYNSGDPSKNIVVVGIDGLQEAIDLIKKGYMTGTVIQDSRIISDAIYAVSMNLVSGANPIKDTNLKIDNNIIYIPQAYKPYTMNSTY